MKIAMFTDHFYPELGGIQDSVMLTARSLGSRGHTVEIFAPRHLPSDYTRAGHDVAEVDLGPNVVVHRRMSVRFASSTQQSRAAIPSPASLIAMLGKRRPDVIHSHSFFGLGLEALAAGRALGVKVVGTNHTNVRGFGPYIPIPVERAADWVLGYFNRCDAVTAPTRAVFEELGLDRLQHAPQVVSNPIDVRVFQPVAPAQRAALKRSFGLAGGVIVYAGRIAAEKNIDILFHALARAPGAPLLALAGHGAHEPALRTLAASLGIADRVRFLGTLAQSDLARLYAAGDVFALMSTSETQSMATLQAMACGLPVIVPDSGPLTEFVSHANGRPVPPDNAERVAAAMAELLGDADLRARLGEAGRLVAGRCSVERVTETWERLYHSLQPQRGLAWSTS
jgi:glycosyltransferase involved in cell wall biosynthesis